MEGPKVIHVLYGGNFSPPTNAHIYGVLEIEKILKKIHPDLAKIKIYWTPTSKAQSDSIVQESCVQEKDRIHMLNLLKAEFDKLEHNNIEISVNSSLIDENKWFYQIDSIQLLIRNFGISPSPFNDIIYTVLTENTLKQLINEEEGYKFSKYVLEDYGILFYPGSTTALESDDIVEKYAINAIRKRNLTKRPRIYMIGRTMPTNEAQIARTAAKEGSKAELLDVVPESIADFILSNKLYTSPSCDYKKGGGQKRKTSGRRRQRLKSRRRR